MSTAASPASVPRTPSSVRRHQSYADRDKYQSTTTTTPTRTTAPTSPRRSLSQSQAPSHSRNNSAQGQLSNVARRDFEQTNVASPNATDDRDPNSFPSRSDSTRQPTTRSGNGQHSRYNSQDLPPPAPAPTNGHANPESTHHTSSSGVRRRTTIDATTGHWELGKTIGAGSMGKVKLARNKETGEQVSVFAP